MKLIHFAPTMRRGQNSRLAADLSYALQAYEDVYSLVISPEKGTVPTGAKLRHSEWSPYPLPGSWGEVLCLRNLITSRQPDILHAYGYAAIITAAKACRLVPAHRRPKLVGSIIGYPPSAQALQAPELQDCAAITLGSKHMRAMLKRENFPPLSTWLIPHGVNETHCYPTYRPSREWQQRWHAAHPELRDRFVICVPGPISQMHGTETVIPIAATLQQQDIPAHILIAGNPKAADTYFMTTLRRRLRSSGMEDRISWESNTASLRDILCSCHAVINLATMPEAYNRPMLEALALGRPVAGYDHGVSAEYLEAFQPVGTVPVGDFDAIADVLSQWHTYPPDPVESIPYPYRLSDTAKSFHELYSGLF